MFEHFQVIPEVSPQVSHQEVTHQMVQHLTVMAVVMVRQL